MHLACELPLTIPRGAEEFWSTRVTFQKSWDAQNSHFSKGIKCAFEYET